MKPDVSVNNLLVRLEGDVPDDHVVQQDPQAPDCCLVAVVLVALDPLWRSVDSRTWNGIRPM